jgi:hypothetical protein
VRVVVHDRKNVATERLREGQRTVATLRIGERPAVQNVQLMPGREFYFEEGELVVPPSFEPTPEERRQ